MADISWAEEAVAVRDVEFGHPGERIIVVQGTLAMVVDTLAKAPGKRPPSLLISLSARRVPPFHYDARQIDGLIRARRRDLARTVASYD